MRSIRGHRRVLPIAALCTLMPAFAMGPHARESGDDRQHSHHNANRAENPECPRTTS
jgi:hypothetical protein